MTLKLSTAKVTDLTTTLDAVPVETATGPVVWATVRITYLADGLEPSVTLCVPVEWQDGESDDQRKSKALRSARQLIDHACNVMVEPAPRASILEGLSQELGLATPTTKPARKMRQTI